MIVLEDTLNSYYPSGINNLAGGINMHGKGTIRTDQKCPKCSGKFEFGGVQNGLICKECLTHPTSYFMDFYWKGERLRLFSDNKGKALKSFSDAYELRTVIKNEIKFKKFEPDKYTKMDQNPFLFQNFAESWLRGYQKREMRDQISPSTLESLNTTMLKYCIPYFKDQDIREINGSEIKEFSETFPLNLKAKTIKNHMDALKKLFKDAYDLDLILKVPVFPKISVSEPLTIWIDEETQDTVLEKILDRDRDIFLFLILHGVRGAEACALQWQDVNIKERSFIPVKTFSRGKLRNTTKTGKIIPRPLHDDMIGILKRTIAFDKEQFVFINPRTRTHYSTDVLRRIWNKATKECGVKVNIHQGSRHSLGSQASNRGVGIDHISKALGHTNLKTTLRYVHVNTSTLRQVQRPSKNKIISLTERRQATARSLP